MSDQPVTPKFMPPVSVKAIIEGALDMIMKDNRFRDIPKRKTCHIIVMVPAADGKPYILVEYSYGDRETWKTKYDEIARSKAKQLWEERNDGRTDVMPHLLMTGDARYWGGVKREGIVVACSGVQPYIDRMIAGVIADLIIGCAYYLYTRSSEVEGDQDFIT